MNKLNRVVSTLCVDKDQNTSTYINLDSGLDRTMVYWKCLLVLFQSVQNIFGNIEKIVFTNLKEEEFTDEILSLTKLMRVNYSVEIIYLDFIKYDPGKFSKKFRNVFYRFEVYEKLGNLEGYSLHLDSDCLVLSDCFQIHLESNNFLAQQQYGWLKNPNKKHHNFNSVIFTEFIGRSLKLKFPNNLLYFGGELVGGNKLFFKKLSIELNYLFRRSFDLFEDNKYYLNKDNRIFDNDEYLFSLAINNIINMNSFNLVDTSRNISKRIWSAKNFNNWRIFDFFKYDIVHLPNEKNNEGIIMSIYEELSNSDIFTFSPSKTTLIFMRKYVEFYKRKLFRFFKKLSNLFLL